MAMPPHYLFTRAHFFTFTAQCSLLAVVEVYSEWCGPCKSILPTFKRIRMDRDDEKNLLFLVVCAEKCSFLEAAVEHRGNSEPLFLLYRVSAGGGKQQQRASLAFGQLLRPRALRLRPLSLFVRGVAIRTAGLPQMLAMAVQFAASGSPKQRLAVKQPQPLFPAVTAGLPFRCEACSVYLPCAWDRASIWISPRRHAKAQLQHILLASQSRTPPRLSHLRIASLCAERSDEAKNRGRQHSGARQAHLLAHPDERRCRRARRQPHLPGDYEVKATMLYLAF